MSNVEINVRDTWQLISQFVCWDICRYAGEQNENISSDIDFLTFLRNMVVKRTEKSISDITKPEIIAKFIMEIKTIKDLSTFPSIIELAKSVVKICPELEKAVENLIYHIQILMDILDSEENFLTIKQKINDAIHKFSKEATTFLSQPDLIKIIESWKHQHYHTNSKPAEKDFPNTALYEEVLKCLHFEKITQPEAKLIDTSLHKDRVFKNMLLNILNELQPSGSIFPSCLHSLQADGCAYECDKDCQQSKTKEVPLQPLFSCTDSSPLKTPSKQMEENVDNLSDNSLEQVPSSEQISIPSRTYTSNNLDNIYQSNPSHKLSDTSKLGNKEASNVLKDFNQIYSAQPDMSSDDEEYGLLPSNSEKSIDMCNLMELETQNQYDSDTSDCEKYSEFRFLTPSLYKQGADNLKRFKAKRIYLSDSDSNDSFVITPENVKQTDPKWTPHSPKATSKFATRNTNKHSKMKTARLFSSDDDLDCSANTVEGSKTSVGDKYNLCVKRKHAALFKTVKLFRTETNFYDSRVRQENNSTN